MADEITREMKLGEMPGYLKEDIGRRLHWYSTPLIEAPPETREEIEPRQLGSGTFISLEGTHGILTAQHVSKRLPEKGYLGLMLEKGKEGRFRINVEELRILDIATPVEESQGPDLSFIRLPDTYVGEIEAREKLFYQLSQHRDAVLDHPFDLDIGAWWVCGVPHEKTEAEESQAGFPGLLHFQSVCFAGGPIRDWSRGGYDYIDFEVDYAGDTDPFGSFSGYSGGGLWQVPIRELEGGTLEPKKVILSGVAFYQTDIKDQKRSIRCHGRRSVYRNVYDAVRSEYS